MDRAKNYVATKPPGVLIEVETEEGHETTIDTENTIPLLLFISICYKSVA